MSKTKEPQYSFTVEWSDEDEGFIALCPEFPGLSAFGDTHEEAIREGMVALGLMIEVTEEDGEELPAPLKFVYGKAKAERAVISAAREWGGADAACNEAVRQRGSSGQECYELGKVLYEKADALRLAVAALTADEEGGEG